MNDNIVDKETKKFISPAKTRKKCLEETNKLMKKVKGRLESSKSETLKNRLTNIQLKLAYLYAVDCVYDGYFVEPKLDGLKLLLCPHINIAVPKKYLMATPEGRNPLNEKRGGEREGAGAKKGFSRKTSYERRTEYIQVKLTSTEKTILAKKANEAGFSDISKYIRSRIL